MRRSLFKAVVFVLVTLGLSMAAGPIVGIAAATTGIARAPVWMYSAIVSVLVLAATAAALRRDGGTLGTLGLAPTSERIGQLALGFAVGAVAFVLLALVRGALVGAQWSFAGWNSVAAAAGGVFLALVLLLPEELLFRGYAFQRVVHAVGARPAILISAALFGVYHVVGTGMWAIGAVFTVAMPALGGVVFGWAAVRTRGLALPIGLHLGGNWVSASVLSMHPQSPAMWTATVTDVQLRTLYAPDLSVHMPYIIAMVAMTIAIRLALRRQREA
jgi:membrane protease YdiL (CAAX protease family)